MKINKVLFVHDGPLFIDSSGNYYGVHVTDTLINRYLNLGSKVTLLMRVVMIDEYKKVNYTKLTSKDFSVVHLPDFKSIRNLFKNFFKAKRLIRRTVLEHDIIVCRQPSAAGTQAAYAAIEFRKPILAELVACTFDAYWNYNWKGKVIAHYKMWVQKRLVKQLPYIVYVTKRFLQNRYPSNAKQINCSNAEIKKLDISSLNIRQSRIQNIVDSTPFKIGTVAALDVPFKGQSDVIKAIALLKKKGFIIEYHLVGQGNRENLVETAKEEGVIDQIKVIGTLKHDQVFDFYDSIDLYIQPSKQEGLPRALIEALSRACPALGARTAGIPELLDDSCIFEPGNFIEIAEKIMSFDSNKMIEQMKMNFNTAGEYDKGILEVRRKEFYDMFLSENNLS